MTKLLTHVRRNAIPYAGAAAGARRRLGGGYALAASKTKTITVCADKGTGVLHLKTTGACKRGQTQRYAGTSEGHKARRASRARRVSPGRPA